MLFKKLEKYPAADNRGENTGKGVQQELHHARNLLCGSWPTGAPYVRRVWKASGKTKAPPSSTGLLHTEYILFCYCLRVAHRPIEATKTTKSMAKKLLMFGPPFNKTG